jgi:hypothetical protein
MVVNITVILIGLQLLRRSVLEVKRDIGKSGSHEDSEAPKFVKIMKSLRGELSHEASRLIWGNFVKGELSWLVIPGARALEVRSTPGKKGCASLFHSIMPTFVEVFAGIHDIYYMKRLNFH